MRESFLLLLFAGLFLTVACTNEVTLEKEPPTEIENVQFTDAELAVLFQMRGGNNKVNMDEATNFAIDVIGFLDGEAATRSGNARKISSVVALTPEKTEAFTRSSDGETIEIPDTIAYLFNFGENEGYAIVSGDKRISSPILAYCDNGVLTEEIDNPGLIGILFDTENFVINSIIDYENQIDSIVSEVLYKMAAKDSASTRALLIQQENNVELLKRYEVEVIEGSMLSPTTTPSPTTTTTTTTTNGWVTTEQVQPLLPVEWSQRFPFNYRVKTKSGCKNAPAGCVATALAQLMAYWQQPAKINGYSFNWGLLRNYTARVNAYPNASGKKQYRIDEKTYQDLYEDGDIDANEQEFVSQASRLLEEIGKITQMKYTDNGSSASTDEALYILHYMGYNCAGLEGYKYSRVINSLKNHQPVIASGKSKKIQHRIKFLGITLGTWSTYEEGHAWIVDGYLNRRKATTVQVIVRNRATNTIVSQTTTTTYSNINYLHHNWGWGLQKGKDGAPPYTLNGYFVAGNFDARDPSKLDSNTRAVVTYDEDNYQFMNKISPNITWRGTGPGFTPII